MKRWTRFIAVGTTAGLVLYSASASAWFTKVNGANDWRSIFLTTGSHHDHTGLSGNEHAEIADHHLHLISPQLRVMFGSRAFSQCDDVSRCAQVPVLIDLNASHLRRDLEGVPPLHLVQAHGDFSDTALEERAMPPVAMFSGLPDFNYTIYDWINKNTRCPSLPLGADSYGACHDYASGWLGAGFNTTHWGDLAVKVYARHHQIALGRAAKASAMDALFRNNPSGLPDGSQWHERYTREMELLALYYESTGQHFLQDRWATGHMFSRWGSPDYEHLPQKDLASATVAATLAGVTHGSREVFGSPDPLNIPSINYNTLVKDSITAAKWRDWPDANLHNGVGDFTYVDVLDGKFGADYDADDRPLDVRKQNQVMTMCATEGFRDVISSFADNDNAFGSFGVSLPEPPAGSHASATRLGSDPAGNPACTSAWVTNASYHEGLRTIAGAGKYLGSGVLHEIVAVISTAVGDGETPEFSKQRFGSVYISAWFASLENADKNPDGIDSAREGIEIKSWGLRPNHNYAVPTYFEPVDLESLPMLAEAPGATAKTKPAGGMDRSAIEGLFNRAHTQSWCDDVYGRLAELREKIREGGPRREEYRAVCSYLAQRVYKAVDPQYPEGGPRFEQIGEYSPFDFERQPAGDTYGPQFEPVCAYFDTTGQDIVQTNDADDDSKPYYIQPGYVVEPGDPGALKYGPKTLENWCDQIPVLQFDNDEDHPTSVATLGEEDGDRTIDLSGANLGFRTGSGEVGAVELQDAEGAWTSMEIWDGDSAQWGGGWSLSDVDVFFRLPGSTQGFPSLADSSMTPAEIIAVDPAVYPLRLTRANDPAAPALFRADGAQTQGSYDVLVTPHWIQSNMQLPSNALSFVQNFEAPTLWFWETMELLNVGFYTVSDDSYTEVPFALELYFDEHVAFDNADGEIHTSVPGNLAVVLRAPGGGTFGAGYSDMVFFIAFH